jgi:hypothetical protein
MKVLFGSLITSALLVSMPALAQYDGQLMPLPAGEFYFECHHATFNGLDVWGFATDGLVSVYYAGIAYSGASLILNTPTNVSVDRPNGSLSFHLTGTISFAAAQTTWPYLADVVALNLSDFSYDLSSAATQLYTGIPQYAQYSPMFCTFDTLDNLPPYVTPPQS